MRSTLLMFAASAALFVTAVLPASAQQVTPPSGHVPLQKNIGQAHPEVVPSLIVMNAQGASLANGKLTLTGIMPNSIVFADRPVRAAGHAMTKHLLEEWTPDEKGDSFLKDPPNATVSVFSKEGDAISDAVVVLRKPTLEGTTLTFDVDVLEGQLSGDGPASVFIDIIGRPLTPFSYAGVARRTAYRAAWYRAPAYGAAVAGAAVAGAAVGAAAAAPYAYGYPPPPPACGYYPYPPCY